MKKPYLILLLILGSCQKRGMDSASMFSKSGDLKDKIAFVNMIDSSFSDKKWDVAEELTQSIQKEIARKDTLYVVPCGTELELSSHKNPFSKETSWLDHHFSNVKYVAFTELLKYQQDLLKAGMTHNLEMALRVRIFANTENGFKPILQEIITQKYLIPTLLTHTINLQPSYKSQGYEISPLGVTHQSFANMVAKRIRDYTKNNPQ
jgi:hypothetical protein